MKSKNFITISEKNMVFSSRFLLILFSLFWVLNFIGCSSSDDPTTETVENFDLTIQVLSNGAGVEDAAVVLNIPIVTKVDRDEISYNQITRYRTNSSGSVTISDLPVKDVDEDEINYEIAIFKSGFDSEVEVVGIVSEDQINATINLTSQLGTTDIKAAFLDYEAKYRASDFLTRNNLLFTDITGKLTSIDLSLYNTLAIGYDASKSVDFVDEFVANKDKILSFVENGGTLFFFQQNDAGWDSDFFPSPLVLVDEAIGNDLESGEILDPNHTITSNLVNDDFEDWLYSEPGQLDQKGFIVFDAILPPTTSTDWHEIVATPSQINQSGDTPDLDKNGEIIPALEYWITAELIHGEGKILINQLAYYQGSYGTLSNPKPQKITNNVVSYLIDAGM